MTTKEFIRRSDLFSVLNICPYVTVAFVERCFKITLITHFNESQVVYSQFLDFNLLSPDLLSIANSVYFEFYSFDQFKIDLGYFKAFYNRLSEYQKQSLKASKKVDLLLRYCRYESSE